MYTVAIRGFHERETREAFHIDTLMVCDDMLRADAKAFFFAKSVDFASSAMCAQHDCDGLFVDVRSDDDSSCALSYEIMPGRTMCVWIGTDCDV